MKKKNQNWNSRKKIECKSSKQSANVKHQFFVSRTHIYCWCLLLSEREKTFWILCWNNLSFRIEKVVYILFWSNFFQIYPFLLFHFILRNSFWRIYSRPKCQFLYLSLFLKFFYSVLLLLLHIENLSFFCVLQFELRFIYAVVISI